MIPLQKFDDYYLTRKIATGGMAEIFRAWKTGEAGFEKQVVIKRMLTHLTSNEEFLSMFLSEAKLVSRLTHANIAQVYDLGRSQESSHDAPTYFIAMEFVFGKNLAQVIKRSVEQKQPLSWECMAGICLGAAQALEYAHELKDEQGQPLHIVHRDISPQNLLITYSGEVKVVDFGIAKALVSRQQTQAGTLKGKLSYMSPEQAMGETVDQRSDIYSLGIVLWEMLTEHRLFTGDSEVGILQKVIKPQVADPTNFRPDIPRPLALVCMNCLQSNPDKRYQSALELIKDLNAYLRQLPNFSGALALRKHMHTLFAGEMLLEKEHIQEELQSVRQALSSPGMDTSATVLIQSDGTLSITPDQAQTAVMGATQSIDTESKTSATISSKILRLANSMRTMTRRAMVLTAASLLLLLILVTIVAMWPEESGNGLEHTASTIAASSPAQDQPSLASSTTAEQHQSTTAPPFSVAESVPLDQNESTSVQQKIDQPLDVQQKKDAPDQSVQITEEKHPGKAIRISENQQASTTTAAGPFSAAPAEVPDKATDTQEKYTDEKKSIPKTTIKSDQKYNPLADPNLQKGDRQFDQRRFDRLQAEFQQEQFAALDSKQSTGAYEGKKIGRDGAPRIKVSQADVILRIWKQGGSAVDVSVLINDQPNTIAASKYTITHDPLDVPVRLQSGQNTVRLIHGGSSIVDGIYVQIGRGPALSLSPGSHGNDQIIVEF